MDFDISERARRLTSSAIREILKVTEDPSVISFAGGIPAPQTFLVALVQERHRPGYSPNRPRRPCSTPRPKAIVHCANGLPNAMVCVRTGF
jgi:hypothetical protein